jgi:hypothetical protein
MDNWHIDAMAYQVGRIMNGEVRRLIVNMPPRNLKSLAFNVALSAFLLGHDRVSVSSASAMVLSLRPSIRHSSRQ